MRVISTAYQNIYQLLQGLVHKKLPKSTAVMVFLQILGDFG